MSTAGIEFIRNEMDWDTYDAWASVRSAQFDIAEAWYEAHGEELPGFRGALGGISLEERGERLCGAMVGCAIITRDDVDYWWRVLDRMEGLVIAAGRDY